jgi:hypothetical protein
MFYNAEPTIRNVLGGIKKSTLGFDSIKHLPL